MIPMPSQPQSYLVNNIMIFGQIMSLPPTTKRHFYPLQIQHQHFGTVYVVYELLQKATTTYKTTIDSNLKLQIIFKIGQ